MKELKLRAYNKQENKLFYSRDDSRGLSNFFYQIEFGGLSNPTEFIGEYDKNKKEIYENDIVKFEEYLPDEGLKIQIGKIVFKNGSFIIEHIKGGYFNSIYNYMYDLEVIGNIFENKELLK